VRILTCSGVIARIIPDSIASEVGLEPGDRLLAVNEQQIRDIIDLSFALADEVVELLIEKNNGEQEILEIEKDYDEDLGIEFESAVFDGVQCCVNKCIFCFVDQMAPGMRESLYVKDDDYRLSFLYGNFVTLTNVTPTEMARIRRLHLSPLYISVHTTNGALREKLLSNKRAGKIMEQLTTLIDSDIELHTQVVLCPGINDGEILIQTIRDLYALHPAILSLAVVPVGLSKYRDNCEPLHKFTADQAASVIDKVSSWQESYRKKNGNSFVYLADEFYLAANYPIPEYEMYDEFPQLENGIGLVRTFLTQWQDAVITNAAGYQEEHTLDVVCGMSAEKTLQPLLTNLNIPNLIVRVVAVDNKFFGPDITVTGLLTGQDIMSALQRLPGNRTGIILPGVALRKGEDVFLDNTTPDDIARSLGVSVHIAYGAHDLRQLLQDWR
jgi:putative radical SAM enzyme (TIGR03279 family)